MPYQYFRLLLVATVLCSGVSSFAQISKSDIEIMRQTGEEEGWTFTVGENGATQYSLDQLCGTVEPDGWRAKAKFVSVAASVDQTIPAAFDWRDLDGCTPVRNQGGCGSCWAFATVGALECAIKIREGVSVDLSEQWLISCNSQGWGCDGGWYAHSYHGWLEDPCGHTGAVLESDFPYRADDGPCGCPHPHHYVLNNWAYIGGGSNVASIQDMKAAILEYGPISVSVHVNNPFQGYNGGIFNACATGEINHSVVLVGWDDSQGDDGVWFLRNSWGSWWGEGGYMRIPYNCNLIGYAACFVDYKPVEVSYDQDFGPSPMTVSFTSDVSGTTVLGYDWDFGDGSSSTEAAPVHEYDQPGCYTLELTVNTTEGDLTRICPDLVSVHADSLKGPSIEITEAGPVRMDISARNTLPINLVTIPFCWTGSFNLTYDSVTNSGTRTAHFGPPELKGIFEEGQQGAVMIGSMESATLTPGEGPIATLWFTAPESVSGANSIEFVPFGRYVPSFRQMDQEYDVTTIDGLFHTGVSQTCCVGKVGDANMSGEDVPTIGDISYLVDHLFINGAVLTCIPEADVNQSGGENPTLDDISIGDISTLIDHLFISEAPLDDCF